MTIQLHTAKYYKENFKRGLQLTENNGELSWLGEADRYEDNK